MCVCALSRIDPAGFRPHVNRKYQIDPQEMGQVFRGAAGRWRNLTSRGSAVRAKSFMLQLLPLWKNFPALLTVKGPALC